MRIYQSRIQDPINIEDFFPKINTGLNRWHGSEYASVYNYGHVRILIYAAVYRRDNRFQIYTMIQIYMTRLWAGAYKLLIDVFRMLTH